jgi:predicted dehydrogenase
MYRRFFLFTAGSAAVYAQVPPSRQLVVGLIGAGSRGLQLLRQCLSVPSIRIGAVCETYEPRMFGAVALARSKGHTTRAYRIYTDLIADSDLDAVLIATPDFSHHRMTLDALGAGKHVYVEQPLCLTWQEGVELLNAEKNSRQIVQIGSQRRSSPFFLEAAREVDAGKIEQVRMVQANRTSSYLRPGVLRRGGAKLREPLNFPDWQATAASKVPYRPDRFLNWRFYSTYGGGPVCDLGVHIMDGVHLMTSAGFPATVTARGVRSKLEGFDTAERAAILIEYPNGLLVSLTIDGSAATPHELSVIDGTGGRLEMDTHQIRGSIVRRNFDAELHTATYRHLENFVASIRNAERPTAPVNLVFPATLICQMANLSITSQRPARWDSNAARVEMEM